MKIILMLCLICLLSCDNDSNNTIIDHTMSLNVRRHCIEGKQVYSVGQYTVMYKLDDNGKPVKCEVKK